MTGLMPTELAPEPVPKARVRGNYIEMGVQPPLGTVVKLLS